MGLFNTDDEDEDTTTPANTTDANADSAEDAGPSPRLRVGQTPIKDDDSDSETPPTSTGPSVADYIKQKYGLTGSGAKYADMMGDSTATVKAARDEANHNKANIGIAQGISQMFGGGTNDKLYNNLRANEDQQAGLAADDRQQMLKNYLTGKGLMRQDTQDATLAADQAQKEKQFDVTNATNDATSPKAQALRDAYKKMFPGVVAQIGDNYNQLSENDLNTYFAKPLEMKQAADARAAQAAQMNQYHQDMLGAKLKIAGDNNDTKTNIADANREAKLAQSASADKYVSSQVKPDKQLTDANSALTAVDDARAVLEDAKTNPASANSIGPVFARILSHGQRINMPEIESQQGGSKAFFDHLAQLAQQGSSGTLTPENAANMNQMLNVFEKSAQKTRDAEQAKHLSRYMKHSGVTNEDDARIDLGFAPARPAAAASPASSPAPTAAAPTPQAGAALQPAASITKPTTPPPTHPVGSIVTLKSGKKLKVIDADGNTEEVP